MDDLKLLITSEWSYDSPAGGNKYYHICWSEDEKDLKELVDETVGNVSLWNLIGDRWINECTEEERKIFSAVKDETNLNSEFFNNLHFDNGGKGYDTEVYAEGKDIAKFAIEFYHDMFYELDYDMANDEEDEEAQDRLDLEINFSENPDDTELRMEFLNMLSNKIDEYNEDQF